MAPDQLCAIFGLTSGRQDISDVMDALEVFREEYGIEPGQLRPDDPMAVFTEFRTSSWGTWLFDRAAYEFSLGEVVDHLGKRLWRAERWLPELPETVGSYVRHWVEASRSDAAAGSRGTERNS